MQLAASETPLDAVPDSTAAPSSGAAVVPPPQKVLPSWPRSAQWAAAVLLAGALILLAYHALANTGHATRDTQLVTEDGPIYRLDVNRARPAELMQVPGIGPELARRIVDTRREAGPFRTVADLRHVSGIGDKTLARIRPWLCAELDEASRDEAPRFAPVKSRSAAAGRSSGGKKEAALAGKTIDVNEADAAQLQRLPRIGPKLAQRIIEERDKQPFATVNDLRRVKGIGPKTLDGLRPFVRMGADRHD